MIDRYSLPEAKKLWTQKAKYETWLEVELAACQAMAKHGIMPKAAYQRLRKKAKINVAEIDRNEAQVKHDVIAFTMSIEKQVGEDAQYFHYGLTSSDCLDTAFSLQMKRSLDLIFIELKEVKKELKKLAMQTKDIATIGRSHGIHAEPMSFGAKFASYYAEFDRNEARLKAAYESVSYGQFSGAVGSYGTLPPKIEAEACRILGLKPEPVSTQVIPRDRYADAFNAMAMIGAAIERISVEFRHLQRTEVMEVEEGFSKKQKGSSAMPHKKNPISAENLTGGARLLRSYAQAAMENIALWHERDISHSSVERIIGPDANILTHYMLVRLKKLLAGLKVNKKQIQRNLDLTRGVVYSGSVLLALVEAGMERDAAYRLVQKHALAAWQGGDDLQTRLRSDTEACALIKNSQWKTIFSKHRGLEHVTSIYRRVFGARSSR